MSCCRPNYDCSQGDNCPVHAQLAEQRVKNIEECYVKWVSDKGLGMLILLGTSSVTLSAIIVGAFWAYSKFAH